MLATCVYLFFFSIFTIRLGNSVVQYHTIFSYSEQDFITSVTIYGLGRYWHLRFETKSVCVKTCNAISGAAVPSNKVTQP